MKESRSYIENIAKPILKKAGYKKTRLTWHKDHGKVIAVFNFQASQWSDEYYINLGIYLKHFGSESRPPEYRCHVRCRLDKLLPDMRMRREYDNSLDFENATTFEERQELLDKWISDFGLPWLKKMSNVSELLEYIRVHNDIFVHKDVRALKTEK